MAAITARDRLIVALDLPALDEARAFAARLGPAVTFYKIGLELAMSGGLELARELAGQGKQVFLDMKLLDIGTRWSGRRAARPRPAPRSSPCTPTTARRCARRVAGKAATGLRILAVTVLTNLDDADFASRGIADTPEELVARRAKLAHDAGCDGVVASGLEAARVRDVVGPRHRHRHAGHPAGRRRGGRPGARRHARRRPSRPAPTTWWWAGRSPQAPDPRQAAEAFVQSIEEALAARSLGPPG